MENTYYDRECQDLHLTWVVEFDRSAGKELAKLGHLEVQRVLTFLNKRVAQREDPRSIGRPLQGSRMGGLWRYRVGNYRLICDIQDEASMVMVLRVGHRRDVYR